jgi:hypothetical protein
VDLPRLMGQASSLRCCAQVILGQVDAPGTGVSSPGGRQHPGSGLALLPSASRTPLLAAVAAPLVYYAPTPLELQVCHVRGGLVVRVVRTSELLP